MPEAGPFGETFFEARDRAMVAASLVKRPSGGKVETVLTVATQRWPDLDLEGGSVVAFLLRADFLLLVDAVDMRPPSAARMKRGLRKDGIRLRGDSIFGEDLLVAILTSQAAGVWLAYLLRKGRPLLDRQSAQSVVGLTQAPASKAAA
jgi:hypothetical protein